MRIGWLLVVLLVVSACTSALPQDAAREETPSCVNFAKDEIKITPVPLVGRPAPDFPVAAFKKVEKLSGLRGCVVLVNFWTTWCPYCRREMPVLEKVYQEYRDQGLIILGVDIKETPEEVEKFLQEVKVSFPIVMDGDGEVFKAYWGTAIPTTFIVDRQGFVFFKFVGEMPQEQIEEVLRQLGFGP